MEKNEFVWSRRLHFREADPAGILFFGNLFSLVHDAYEEYLEHLGFPWEEWFGEKKPYIVPIRQLQAEYQKPLRPGLKTHIGLELVDVGESSYRVQFRVWQKSQQEICCQGHLVLVFADPEKGKKITIPPEIRAKLSRPRP